MTPIQPDQPDPQADSKTLWYEYHQFSKVASLLRSKQYDRTDNTVHNALVESFVIHFRAIGCFFFPKKGFPPAKSDDITAEDFVTDWNTSGPAPSQLLVDAKECANKQVAHMTTERRNLNFVPGTEYNWQIDEIERQLLDVLRTFLHRVTPSVFDTQALAALRQLVSRPITRSAFIASSGPPLPKTYSSTNVRTSAPNHGLHGKTAPPDDRK